MREISIAIVVLITGWMLRTWLNHQVRMKELSLTNKGLSAAERRLERVEQAVEAIAIEVERIGEGQRYVTTMLDSRAERALEALPSSKG